ncbi:MAG: ABC transporter ATP-binding protein [Thermoprotei archaeon]
MSVVELKNVTKVYRLPGAPEVWALRNINLKVRRGEFLSIMGPSGHGKTTLLQIIGLLDKPTSGTVIINGVEVNGLSDNELARFRNKVLGFVFQQYNLINRMSVLENIEIPLIIRGIPRSKRIEIVKEALMMVGGDLTWLTKKPSQLSGGQQQRVAIARAIVGNPEIILADEPTGNLDSESSKIIMETFVKLNKTGKTIIMVTHNPEIAMCSERIVLIRDGIIVGEERSDPSKSILYVKR